MPTHTCVRGTGGWECSQAHCTHTNVHVRACVAGQVGLTNQAGGIPVKGVRVTYALGPNAEVTGVVETDSAGRFEVYVKTHALTAANQRLTLGLEKTSGGGSRTVKHKFLCDKVVPCVETVLTLSHLDFDQEIVFIDDTTEPFTGAVFIKGTEHASYPGGCPLPKVQVCLNDFVNPSVVVACTTTNARGEYFM